jgi:hypothetical protein
VPLFAYFVIFLPCSQCIFPLSFKSFHISFFIQFALFLGKPRISHPEIHFKEIPPPPFKKKTFQPDFFGLIRLFIWKQLPYCLWVSCHVTVHARAAFTIQTIPSQLVASIFCLQMATCWFQILQILWNCQKKSCFNSSGIFHLIVPF